jgi:hypothetical protein
MHPASMPFECALRSWLVRRVGACARAAERIADRPEADISPTRVTGP